MTNRLRIQNIAGVPKFKMSAPGFDVDSATEAQTLFDISAANYGGVYMSGIVPQSSFAASTTANFYGLSNYLRFEVAFGKTFTALPKILLSMNDPLLGAGYYGPQYEPTNYTGSSGCLVQCYGQVENDKLVLIMARQYVNGTLYGYPANVSYVVYQV